MIECGCLQIYAKSYGNAANAGFKRKFLVRFGLWRNWTPCAFKVDRNRGPRRDPVRVAPPAAGAA